ncbi:polysaccharide deacetylase [Sphingomonas sp. Tas61C01]|uniref:polysaccharide deacetylase n=1 Tax=Sphingomonas sp. Tas61C01 TaxID=3458297 RepID=UPI00403EB5A9
MVTPVFLTADIEFAWRHHAAGCDPDELYRRSIEPAGVGLGFQLETLRRRDLKACFFVDPMPAVPFGLDPIRRIVDTVLEAGQEVQLHLHPNWAIARADDAGERYGRFQLHEYDFDEQCALIAGATDLLVAAGAPPPIAFRAGNYGADDDTLRALATNGFVYDSSHNGAQASLTSRLSLARRCISPVAGAVIEVPVTVIEDSPGSLRTFQLCALSSGEASDALDHAAAAGHAAVTIVSHGFELANRAGTRANMVHVRRFEALCDLLDDRRDELPTVHFKDRPRLRLDADDAPLGPDMLRTRWRQAEQLWSNWVAERVA